MGSYGRDEDLDEYEDDFIDDQDGDVPMKRYDDYEEAEEYEEEEEVEEEKMSDEALKILKYRQKIKEQLRRKENGGSSSMGRSSDQVKRPPLYNFGSFFGPSQPVISDRVAQETKALFETRHLTPKASTSQNNGKKVNSAPSTSGTKSGVSRPPHASQVKSKVEIMKQTRDYSFLLSDDADVPKLSKDPGKPKNFQSNADTRPVSRPSQVPTQRSLPSGSSARKMANGYEQTQQRKPSGYEQTQQRKPNGYEQTQQRKPNGYEQTQQRKPNGYEQTQQRKPNGYEQTQQRKPNGYEQTQQRKPNGPPQSSSACNTQPVQKSTSVNRPNGSSDPRRQQDLRKHPQPTKQAGPSSVNGSVRPPSGRPLSPKTPLSSNDRRMPVEKRPHVGTSDYRDRRPPISKQTPPTNGQRPPANGQRPPTNVQRPPVEKPRVCGGRPQDHNVNVQHSRDRVLKKENVTASNSQMRPPKQMSARPNLDRQPSRPQQRPNGQSSVRSQPGGVRRDSNPNPRKRRAEEMDDNPGVDYSSIIQKMFGYNKNKYADIDDDTDDMEVGFDVIRKEESRSAKIAKREDEIELAKIQEEERLEKERAIRRAKMRKMSQR